MKTAVSTEIPTESPPTDPPPETAVIQRVTYAIAGQPIAMRVSGDPVAASNGLHYLYSDHPRLRGDRLGGDRLGSNSAMQAPDGTITRTRYEPFGAYRGGSGGNAITDRGFTGHKQNDSLGLIYMNARFYVPGIARFASADTIVPDPKNPQSFNRYSYVENNPIKYTDPSGHCIVGYSGEVRMNQGSYGTSGICSNTMSWIDEGNAAMAEYREDLEVEPLNIEPIITQVNEPKPEFPITAPWTKERGDSFSDFTDIAGVGVSVGKTVLSGLGVASNFASIPWIGSNAVDKVEDGADIISAILDITGEIATGNTRRDFRSNEATVILGQDVSQSLGLILIDRALPGSEVDLMINVYETYYGIQKLRGEMPNQWETRIGTVAPYFEVRSYEPR